MRDLTERDNCRGAKFLCGVVEGFYGRPWTGDQRKRLFKWMKKMDMNTYLYAPKDDSKHRMYWRDLYSVEEADALTALKEAAEENGVSFVYAISPGLDITYSSSKDVQLLKKKLDQVTSFGCKSFALLFDDIEIEMCEADKEIFQSFAQAQVSVTNEVFQYLNQPAKFLFCPTEYCASRAVPNVSLSEYLNTIGSKLLPGVDILWTGPKVISKHISVQSVEELTAVLKRPPVLWDNIHANDYDQKRLFLGPYDGRSTDLIPHLNGVLTNPNCEFEANYIAFHTLSQWYQSNIDGIKRESLLCDNPLTADIRLETESDYGSDEESQLFLQSNYKPRKALLTAITDWMEEIHSHNNVKKRKDGGAVMGLQVTNAPTPVVNTCMANTLTTNTPSLPVPVPVNPCVTNLNELVRPEISDSYLQPAASQNPVSSLVDSGTDTDEESPSEPMDCLVTPGTTPASTTDSIPLVMAAPHHHSCPHKQPELCDDCSECKSLVSNCDSMQVDSVVPSTSSVIGSTPPEELITPVNERCLLTHEDITLLVELFYLPFEHGSTGVRLLNEFCWLKMNCFAISDAKMKNSTDQIAAAVIEWRERAQKFRELVATIGKLIERLCNSPNQGLVFDMFPYVWDIWGTASLLGSFVEWLDTGERSESISVKIDPFYFALGEVPYINVGYMSRNIYTYLTLIHSTTFVGEKTELDEKEAASKFMEIFMEESQKTLRMLPLETAVDLLQTCVPPQPTPKMMRVRPYMPQDEAMVYEICRKTYNDGCDASDTFPNYPGLVGDKMVGAFLTLSPEYCFVMEGEQGVCGFICAALDAVEFQKKTVMAWIPSIRAKYPKPATNKLCGMTRAEEDLIMGFHKEPTFRHEKVYPSILCLSLLRSCMEDQQCPRHALALCVAALKSNGSCGVYTSLKTGHKRMLEYHAKLGFFDLSVPNEQDSVLIGRAM